MGSDAAMGLPTSHIIDYHRMIAVPWVNGNA